MKRPLSYRWLPIQLLYPYYTCSGRIYIKEWSRRKLEVEAEDSEDQCVTVREGNKMCQRLRTSKAVTIHHVGRVSPTGPPGVRAQTPFLANLL